tara:strand:+ start:2997 stop:4598 length:1602 start_codon:yes stop_codon:yes gene_type:complete
MKYFLIIQFIISFVFGTRVFDSHGQYTLDNNRSCGQRPILDYTITSPSGHFLIHFDNYYTGIEEYANNVSIAADLSREIIVDIMNFRPEIADDDGLYDIYIKQLPNGSYGWNCLEGNLGASWVEIDDNYIGSNYSTTGEDAMRISIAHEFFHAIQRAYAPIPGSNSFFYELSSIWIEDIIYPEINDYIFFSQYGDDYFSDPDQDMDSYNGYGLGLYGHYLNFKFDNQIMQRIWEAYSSTDLDDEDVFNAINEVLMSEEYGYDSSFIDTWIDFNTRNLFNGYFSNPNNEVYYYSDQTQFEPIETNPISLIYECSDSMISNEDCIEQGYDLISRWPSWDNNDDIILSDKSVVIKSFVSDESPYLFDFNSTSVFGNENYRGTISIIDPSYSIIDYDIDNFSTTHQYISDVLDEHIFHIMYIGDESTEITSVIYAQAINLNTAQDIVIYPNPLVLGGNLSVKINNGVEASQFLIKLYSIDGRLLDEINLGSINYTLDNFNLLNIPFFKNSDYISSGIYILSFNMDGMIQNKKIIYLK